MVRDLFKVYEDELRKFRDFHFYAFAYVGEIDDIRKRLTDAGVRFRTKPVYSGNVLLGYNIYVEG